MLLLKVSNRVVCKGAGAVLPFAMTVLRPHGSSIMTDSRDDCERISRRMVVTGAALALGAAAAATVVPPAEAQEKMSQADAKISGYAEGRPALRRLHALRSAERVQGRRRRNQPERLVPAVRQEDLELLDAELRAPAFSTLPGVGCRFLNGKIGCHAGA